MAEKTPNQQLAEKLLYKPAYVADKDADVKQKAHDFAEGYKKFLDAGKTEREVAAESEQMLKDAGYQQFDPKKTYKPGDKIYFVQYNKAVVASTIGTKSFEDGFHLVIAHTDSPRLDLRPTPLYESDHLSYFKTHYYGGIRKYQWGTIPLSIHGVFTREDGSTVTVRVGEDENDPVFCITDLLPHLGAEQNARPLKDGIKAEELNILIGSDAVDDENVKEAVKLNTMILLNEKYGITEKDFARAEIEIVPAYKSRDVGFDRSMIGGYGHDDRVCAYAALQDWSALFQFAYSHSREKVIYDNITESHFDTSTDVVKSLAQRIGVRLFLDRELKPAPVTFAAVLTGGEGMSFAREYSAEINRLGLIARIGTLVAPDGKLDALPASTAGLLNLGINFPEKVTLPVFQASSTDSDLLAKMTAAGVLKPEWYQADKGLFNASSGQIALDSQKETFKAVAPSCEALILPAKMQGEGAFMKVDNKVGRGVFSVMSVDGKPLTESGRLLLLHLTNSLANKMKFSNAKATRLETWGELPFLAARGEAEIELATPPGTEYKLFTVNTAGERLEELPVARNAAGIAFPVKVFTAKGSVFAYELLRQ